MRSLRQVLVLVSFDDSDEYVYLKIPNRLVVIIAYHI